MAASLSSELLQARMEIWNLGSSYVRSMALQCAVNLGIPNAIHRCGGRASLPELLAVVPVPEHRKPYIPRLMRFLAAIGIVALDVPPSVDDGDANGEATAKAAGTGGVYRLTPVSRLLVDDVLVNGCTSLAPFVLMQTAKYHVSGFMHLSEWFKGEDGPPELAAETPFKMAHGTDLWGAMHRDPQFNEVFNAAMVSDSQLMLDFVVSLCGEVFDGIASLVDVGGGAGGAARAIAEAFPHVKCSVLDLPTVISSVQPVDSTVEYIAGDMMDSIPPTDAVLLKYVLHNWNDEECVKILTRCKKAICSRNPAGGKVIIIDMVVGSPDDNKTVLEAQASVDMLMMMSTSGKERDEQEWRKIFMDAGFGRYKASPVMNFLSIIELYP